MQTVNSPEWRSALFVDFDNIFTSLYDIDPEAARIFANNPDHWLTWLERHHRPEGGGESIRRRILVRKCYLNPKAFHEFRPYFIKAAFDVVDCPPLTRRGKTSADIHLVMDALDLLHHETRFDEFIVLSGDADFTPLLIRLRAYDRRTTVSSVGFVSPAYAAASDYVLPEEVFMDKVLVHRDHGSGEAFDNAAPIAVEIVRRKVADSSRPVAIAPIAEAIRKELQAKDFDTEEWFGFGTVSGFLHNLDIEPLKLSYTQPKYIYDPSRHDAPKVEDRNHVFKRDYPELYPIAQNIQQKTNIPFLLPEDYNFIFRAIEEEVNINGMSSRTSTIIRDMCYDESLPASRSQINFIFSSIRHGGLDLSEAQQVSVDELAKAFLSNVNDICKLNQFDLTQEEMTGLFDWISGKRAMP